MIELYDNLTEKQKRTLLQTKQKRTSHLLRLFLFCMMICIYFHYFKPIFSFEPSNVVLYIIIVLAIVLFAKEYNTLTTQSFFLWGITHSPQKIIFNEENIIFKFQDKSLTLAVDDTLDTHYFILDINEQFITLGINSIFMLTKNEFSESKIVKLQELFNHYKQPHTQAIPIVQWIYICDIPNTLILNSIFLIHQLRTVYLKNHQQDIIILMLSIIDLFTIKLGIFSYFILRLFIILLFVLKLAHSRKQNNDIQALYCNEAHSDFALYTKKKGFLQINKQDILEVYRLKKYYHITTIKGHFFIAADNILNQFIN